MKIFIYLKRLKKEIRLKKIIIFEGLDNLNYYKI